MIVWFAGLVGALIGVQWAQQRSAPLRKPSTLGVEVVKPRQNELPRLDVEAVANDVAPSVVAVQAACDRRAVSARAIGTGLITDLRRGDRDQRSRRRRCQRQCMSASTARASPAMRQ